MFVQLLHSWQQIADSKNGR